ncbi:MAG TPA: glycosyltransferase family 4 protein [Acidobacteriaceae bacterium]|nr:glycosyltransferase family 4 protein [Acidobacteriaceae bacterium]
MKSQHKAGICIVVENLAVPLDRRVWKEACALRDAGYRVSVVSPKGRGFTKSYEELDGIEIYRHSVREGRGVGGYIIEYGWALAMEFLLTLRIFMRTRFRILQACNPPDTIFLIALFFKLFGVRFVFDHHDLCPELFEAKFGRRSGMLYRLSRFFESCTFRTADISIATNDSFKEIATGRGGRKEDKVFIVRNSPDLSKFRKPAGAEKGKFGRSFLVAYVGFMGSQDGIELLLESIDELVNVHKRCDTHFVLVGGGDMLKQIEAIIATKNLGEYVTMTGQVTHDEVAAWLASADIGVAPDPKNVLNDNLTMIKILEYMAFSLPVVLYDLKEGRYIADAAALYAAPNDPADFARNISKLLDNDNLRAQLGSIGRKRIEEGLNWDAERRSLLNAYAAAGQAR